MPPKLTPEHVMLSDLTALKHAAQTVFDRVHESSETIGHSDETLREIVSQTSAALSALTVAERRAKQRMES